MTDYVARRPATYDIETFDGENTALMIDGVDCFTLSIRQQWDADRDLSHDEARAEADHQRVVDMVAAVWETRDKETGEPNWAAACQWYDRARKPVTYNYTVPVPDHMGTVEVPASAGNAEILAAIEADIPKYLNVRMREGVSEDAHYWAAVWRAQAAVRPVEVVDPNTEDTP